MNWDRGCVGHLSSSQIPAQIYLLNGSPSTGVAGAGELVAEDVSDTNASVPRPHSSTRCKISPSIEDVTSLSTTSTACLFDAFPALGFSVSKSKLGSSSVVARKDSMSICVLKRDILSFNRSNDRSEDCMCSWNDVFKSIEKRSWSCGDVIEDLGRKRTFFLSYVASVSARGVVEDGGDDMKTIMGVEVSAIRLPEGSMDEMETLGWSGPETCAMKGVDAHADLSATLVERLRSGAASYLSLIHI